MARARDKRAWSGAVDAKKQTGVALALRRRGAGVARPAGVRDGVAGAFGVGHVIGPLEARAASNKIIGGVAQCDMGVSVEKSRCRAGPARRGRLPEIRRTSRLSAS